MVWFEHVGFRSSAYHKLCTDTCRVCTDREQRKRDMFSISIRIRVYIYIFIYTIGFNVYETHAFHIVRVFSVKPKKHKYACVHYTRNKKKKTHLIHQHNV